MFEESKYYLLVFFTLFLFFLECEDHKNDIYADKYTPKNELDFTLIQRTDTLIDLSGNKLLIYLDDIAGKQSILKLKIKDSILFKDYIYSKSIIHFSFAKKNYTIICRKLENLIIGYDKGYFTLKKWSTENVFTT